LLPPYLSDYGDSWSSQDIYPYAKLHFITCKKTVNIRLTKVHDKAFE